MTTIELSILEDLVNRGEVDTVVTVFPDIFGRFMGKRITGHFFLEKVAERGMHACDYLLACDVEMDPVPGYDFASWSSGYGDVHAVPDVSTLRILPWLEKTAFVLCDLFRGDEDSPVAVSPRRILRRQLERAHTMGLLPMGGSELEFYTFKDTYESAKAKHYHDLEPYGWYIEEAIEALESSELARHAFGDDVVEHYLHAARTEVRTFSESVTCWERNRRFERT